MAQSGPQLLPRKERERLVKRQEIISAARMVFASKGYENATLDEIAEQAQFAKGTLYNYFNSKENLWGEILESSLNDLEEIAKEAISTGGTVRVQFHRYATRTMEYYKSNKDLLCILSRETSRMQMEEGFARLMKNIRGIASVLGSSLKKEINRKTIIREDPVDLALAFVGMTHNRSMRRLFEGKSLATFDPEQEAKFLVRLFFDGCTTA